MEALCLAHPDGTEATTDASPWFGRDRGDHGRESVVRKEQTHCSCSSILWILVIRTDNRRMGAPEVGGLEPRALSGAGFARRIIMRRQPTNSVPPRAFWGPARLFR
jgi:hypothetical protein